MGEAGEDQPGSPPAAADTAQRRGGVVNLRLCDDADDVLCLAVLLVLNDAVDLGEKRIIAPDANVDTGTEPGSPLTDEDTSGADALAAVSFDAEVLRVAVATVARASNTFLVCHGIELLADDLRNLNSCLWLAVTPPDPESLPALLLKHDYRIGLVVI